MRVIQLSQTSTKNANIYMKRAIIVCRNDDEQIKLLARLKEMTTYKRRKRVYVAKSLNEFLPVGDSPLLYVEYRFRESLHWEDDIKAFIDKEMED